MNNNTIPGELPELNEGEIQLIKWIADELEPDEIADLLKITAEEVRERQAALAGKMNVLNVVGIALAAWKHGLLQARP